jgi:hypothetical protein
MIPRLLAIALLAMRAALRSRMVAALLVLLAGCVLGLPRMLRGDGTPAGDLAILLEITLTACFGVLALATLWAGCATLAAERDSRLLDLTRVKPVPGIELWLGKWLGMLALNALLLAAVVVGVRAQIALRRTPSGASFSPLLTCRRVAHPLLPTPEAEAQEALRRAQAQGPLPAGMNARRFYREQLQMARNHYMVVNPGETAVWQIALARPLHPGEPLLARFRFDVEWGARADVRGVCRVRRAGATAWAAHAPVADFTMNTLDVPLDSAALAGADRLELAFEHAGPPDSAALLINPRQNVVLLTPGGSFAGNLFRAAVVQLALLALLAALGLTLACAFSFPVAAFGAGAALLLALVSASLARDPPEPDESDRLFARSGRALVLQTGATVQPLLSMAPIPRLTAGEQIGWHEVGRAVGIAGLAWPAALAIIGTLALRRREAIT